MIGRVESSDCSVGIVDLEFQVDVDFRCSLGPNTVQWQDLCTTCGWEIELGCKTVSQRPRVLIEVAGWI